MSSGRVSIRRVANARRRLRWLQASSLFGGLLVPAAFACAQTLPPVPLPGASQAEALAFPASAGSQPESASLPVSRPNTYLVPSVTVLATQTSNANLGTNSGSHSDTILDVMPRVFLQSSHARWQVQGDLTLHGLVYAQGTNSDVVAPSGDAKLHSEWMPGFLYLDAGFNAYQSAISPYVGQTGPVQGAQYTTMQWRLSPYVRKQITPSLQFLARSDDTWTHVSNTPTQGGVYGGRYLDQTLRLEQRPQTLGYLLQAEQTYATYNSEAYAWLRDTTLRAMVDLAATPQLVLGVIGGHEKVQAFDSQVNASIYGLHTEWKPGAYASLDATIEHRYFGTGWQVAADAGSQAARLRLGWRRDVSSALSPLGNGGNTTGGNIGDVLNALLTTQYPDPLQRVRAVQDLLGSAGLPYDLSTSGNFYTATSVLQNNLVLTGLLIHVRDSVAVSLYRNRVEDLYLPGQQALQLLQTNSSNLVQTGVAVNYAHRLTPLDNLSFTLQRENDDGFGVSQGLSARTKSLIVQLDHRMSPSTIGLIGVRRQLLSSTQVQGGTESALFAGLVHRF